MKRWWVIVVVVVALLAIVGGLLIRKNSHSSSSNTQVTTDTTSQNPAKNNPYSQYSQGKCQGLGPVKFTYSPMKPEDVGSVQPYGIMVGAHVIPTDHGYFAPIIFNSPRDAYPVYAIADGYIVRASHRGQSVGDGPKTE